MVESGPDENTLLLLHGEDISDSSKYKRSIENVGVSASTNRSKFGNKSLYFNGLSYLRIQDIPFPNGSEDFTVDWWQYCVASQPVTGVISRAHKPRMGYGILFGHMQNMTAFMASGLSWDIMSGTTMGSRIYDEWQHFAVVRQGNKFLIFNNGSKVSEVTNDAAFTSFEGPLYIGEYDYDDDTDDQFTGYLDELRISNIARWTENFTPPTEPY